MATVEFSYVYPLEVVRRRNARAARYWVVSKGRFNVPEVLPEDRSFLCDLTWAGTEFRWWWVGDHYYRSVRALGGDLLSLSDLVTDDPRSLVGAPNREGWDDPDQWWGDHPMAVDLRFYGWDDPYRTAPVMSEHDFLDMVGHRAGLRHLMPARDHGHWKAVGIAADLRIIDGELCRKSHLPGIMVGASAEFVSVRTWLDPFQQHIEPFNAFFDTSQSMAAEFCKTELVRHLRAQGSFQSVSDVRAETVGAASAFDRGRADYHTLLSAFTALHRRIGERRVVEVEALLLRIYAEARLALDLGEPVAVLEMLRTIERAFLDAADKQLRLIGKALELRRSGIEMQQQVDEEAMV